MIKISFFTNDENEITGFDFIGHAGFADNGNDIVCAAVSALVFNTVNSIDQLTALEYDVKQDEKKGHFYFRLKGKPDHDTDLLLNSLRLGVGEIQKEYGKKYIRIEK